MGECYQWEAIGQCSKGDSCSFSHDPASEKRDKKDILPLLHRKRRHKLTGRYPQKFRPQTSETRRKIPCRNFTWRKCTYPSCNFWHPPVCLNFKSALGCTYGEKCLFRHVEAEGQPSKKSKKSGVKGSVALSEESVQ